jgi:hypothetical protein
MTSWMIDLWVPAIFCGGGLLYVCVGMNVDSLICCYMSVLSCSCVKGERMARSGSFGAMAVVKDNIGIEALYNVGKVNYDFVLGYD